MSENVDVNFRANFESMKASMEGILGQVKDWGSKIAGIFAGAFTGFIGWEGLKTLKEWLALGREGELVQARFAAQITATGGAAGYTAQQLEQMASAMEKHSLSSSTAIKDAESVLLRFTNVRDTQFTRALAAAGDASAAKKGGSIVEEAESLGRALDSPTQGMFRLSREGIRLTETQKSLITAFEQSGNIIGAQNIILAAFEAKWKGVDQTLADTTSQGAWAKIQHQMQDIREEIGGALIPIFDKLLPYVKESAEWFQHWADVFSGNKDNFADGFARGLKYVGDLFKWLGGVAWDFGSVVADVLNTITGADGVGDWQGWFDLIKRGFELILNVIAHVGAAIQTAAGDFKDSWQVAIDAISYGFSVWYEDIKNFMTVEAPAYAKYFQEVFQHAMAGAFNFTGAGGIAYQFNAFMNKLQDEAANLHDAFFSGIPGFHKATRGPKLPEGPTDDGSEAPLPDLPTFGPRATTQVEQDRKDALDRSLAQIQDRWAENLKNALEKVGIGADGKLKGWEGVKLLLDAKPEGAEAPGQDAGGGKRRPPYTNYTTGFQSQLEDFNAYYKRINQAAASEPQRAYEQTTAESTKQAAADLRESKELHRRVAVATEQLLIKSTTVPGAVFSI